MTFIIYPAIDLRKGKVVRLEQGDPERQATYADDLQAVATSFIRSGAKWLHVINLDGAFGDPGSTNLEALRQICGAAHQNQTRIQFGGGLRSLADCQLAMDSGADRLIFGTLAIEQSDQFTSILRKFGPERVVVSLDARHGFAATRGWADQTRYPIIDIARRIQMAGIRTVIYTDIGRDGMRNGPDIAGAHALMTATGLEVIASGGVGELQHIQQAKSAGLAGIIVGKALYENSIDLSSVIQDIQVT